MWKKYKNSPIFGCHTIECMKNILKEHPEIQFDVNEVSNGVKSVKHRVPKRNPAQAIEQNNGVVEYREFVRNPKTVYDTRVYKTEDLIYYFENIVDYANLISFVEQELHNYIEYMEKFKNFRINVDLENLFKRDKLRNFLLKYNEKENKYNLEFINCYTKYINYWDINIKKKFFSCLLGKDRLKEFMLNKKRVFRINGVDYFQIEEKEKYSEIYRIEIENDIKIEYYSKDLEYESFGNVGFLYKEKNFDIENKSLKGKELNFERYRDNRDEMNVERISKEDFLKELEIIVNTYEDIYNDNEVQKMFENFKENF